MPDKPSIAVLPLQTFSGNPDDDFLADGLTEDLTTALASVPWLFVIARNSAFTYKGLAVDIRHIGRDLGVRYVVEGSVRRAGDRARITAQLVDCLEGKHIWADKFDGTVADVFDLQDRIVEEIVRAVAPQVQSAEMQKSARKRPTDRTSYDLYLGALGHLNTGRIAEAEALLESAVAANPEFASAKAVLGWCTTLRVAWRSEDKEEALRDKGEKLSREALESAERNIETEAYAGYTLGFHLRDIPLGMELVAGAAEQCPSFAWAWTSRSFLESFFGDPHRGLEFAERALRLNPRDPLIFRVYRAITTACIGTGDYQRALDMAREGLKYNGSILALHLQKISALARMQRLDEARAEATSVLKRHPDFRVSRFLEYRGRFNSSAGMADDLRASGLPQ